MNIPKVIMKSTILATCIFWIIIFSDDLDGGMIHFIPLSMIPICICCSLTIVFSILPFFWTKKKGQSNSIVFKKFFPFYAIVSFSLCLYGFLVVSDIICFFAAAFFTSLQSWVWLTKGNETKPQS